MTWDELSIPAALREVAQQIWDVLDGLAGAHGDDAAASGRMDELGAAYAGVFADAAAISHDAMEEARAEARKAGAKAARERAAAHPAATSRTVADAGGRELLGALRGRVVRRVRGPGAEPPGWSRCEAASAEPRDPVRGLRRLAGRGCEARQR